MPIGLLDQVGVVQFAQGAGHVRRGAGGVRGDLVDRIVVGTVAERSQDSARRVGGWRW